MDHGAVDRFEAGFHLAAKLVDFALHSVEAIADVAEAPVDVGTEIVQRASVQLSLITCMIAP